jgi:hypothetical protein
MNSNVLGISHLWKAAQRWRATLISREKSRCHGAHPHCCCAPGDLRSTLSNSGPSPALLAHFWAKRHRSSSVYATRMVFAAYTLISSRTVPDIRSSRTLSRRNRLSSLGISPRGKDGTSAAAGESQIDRRSEPKENYVGLEPLAIGANRIRPTALSV